MDGLERILEEDEGLEPSSGLTDSVMRAVLDEASAPPPLQFPWLRLGPGIGACLLLLGIAVIFAVTQGLPEAAPVTETTFSLDPRLSLSVGAPLGALLMAYVAFRLSMRATP